MSKKLLSEAQVRRFQSLASIAPLQEMYKEGEYNEELYEEEDPMDDAPPAGDDMDDEAGEDSDVELDEELVQRFVEAAGTIQEMADALGGAAEADDAELAPMDEPADEPAMDIDADAPPEEPAGDEDEEEDAEDILQEALRGVNYIPSKKEVVNEVAKRVAKRIMEAKEAHTKLNRALGKTK